MVALLKDIVRVLELSSQLVVKPFILVQPSLDMILLTTISTVAALGVVIIEDISQFYSKMNKMDLLVASLLKYFSQLITLMLVMIQLMAMKAMTR